VHSSQALGSYVILLEAVNEFRVDDDDRPAFETSIIADQGTCAAAAFAGGRFDLNDETICE